MVSIFSCAYWLSFLEKCLRKLFDYIWFRLIVTVEIYILDINPLSDMSFINISFHSMGYIFHLLDRVLWCTKYLILMKSNYIFCFACAFGVIFLSEDHFDIISIFCKLNHFVVSILFPCISAKPLALFPGFINVFHLPFTCVLQMQALFKEFSVCSTMFFKVPPILFLIKVIWDYKVRMNFWWYSILSSYLYIQSLILWNHIYLF